MLQMNNTPRAYRTVQFYFTDVLFLQTIVFLRNLELWKITVFKLVVSMGKGCFGAGDFHSCYNSYSSSRILNKDAISI